MARAAACAAALLLLGCGEEARKQGPGAFTAELSTCQLYIFDATRHPSDMEFLKEGVWHEGSATNLRIGGMLTQLDARLRPQGRSYECRMRDGRVIDWAMR